MSEFLQMGGYGSFVWPSYLVTAVVMVAVWLVSLRELKGNRKRLETLRAAGAVRRRRAGAAPSSSGKEAVHDA